MWNLLSNVPKFVLALAAFICAINVAAQDLNQSGSQEISEKEGVPVLVKHLPDWETKKDSSVFVTKKEDLQGYLNDREVIERIDFIPGTEAVLASYSAGKLVIIEFASPQASSDADARVKQHISEGASDYFYRRIGNYNVFLFDGVDESAANALFDQVKYEKVVQWLGSSPSFLPQGDTEREFIVGASSLFVATVVVILSGFGISAVLGVIFGILYFYFQESRRSSFNSFSDAGGMTRLNLDGLSAEQNSERLLSE